MKLRYVLPLLFLLLFTLAVSAKETVIYQNDFSRSDLSAFIAHGNFTVRGGRLYTTSGSGPTAYLAYNFPAAYTGCDYRVEVDVYGHGELHEGLLIGATGENLATVPSYFSGYTCALLGRNAAIAYFSETGWGGAFSTGIARLDDCADYHLSATVRHGILRFDVTTLDGQYVQSYRFEPATSDEDIYDTFTSTVGLRKYYDDASFDNFKLTIITDDLPTVLSEETPGGDYTLSANLTVHDETTLFFGMTDRENGYAVTFSEDDDRATFFRVENGKFVWMAERAFAIDNTVYPVSVTACDGVLSLRCDGYTGGDFPVFEFPIDDADGAYAVSGGLLTDAICTEAFPKEGETYLNPIAGINSGADPDILYYDGTYYLYVYANSSDKLFMLYTSEDLVHFTRRGYVFPWDETLYANVTKGTPWSPNVFYHESEKLFYLTFAAEPADGSPRTLYYATSESPLGPFTHDGPLVAIHEGENEIDGHLYSFGDGKVYISLSRYDRKGNVWLEEVELKDGRIIAKPETAVCAILPEAPYENDGVNSLCEGGSLFKYGDWYYLLYATGSYARHYGEAYAVSRYPLGPYTRADNNPILQYNAYLDGPGDALLIPSPDGSEIFIVYHRHDHVGQCNPRKTCIDRVAFIDNPNGGAPLLTVCGPSSTPQKVPSLLHRDDPSGDGRTSLLDVLSILRRAAGNENYSLRHDANADGAVSVADALFLLRKVLDNRISR